ncbi:non-ribosomal peptide synthase/polyketide synthase, partial [Paenibacillus thiaminolyticus]
MSNNRKESQLTLKNTWTLTEAQRRVWYMELLNPNTTVAALNSLLTLQGTIVEEKIIQSIQMLASRHDSLRVRLKQMDGQEPQIYVVPFEPFHVDVLDVSGEGAEAWQEIVDLRSRQPFALFDSPLFEFTLFRTGELEARLFLKIHHVIADGYSLNLLGNEIIQTYMSLLRNEEPPMEPAPSFTELLASEDTYLASSRFLKDKAYWDKEFSTLPPITSLAFSERAAQTATSAASYSQHQLPLSACKDIHQFCEKHQVSAFNLLVTALCLYLARICGEEEVVLGTMYANRTSVDQKTMVGMLVSTTPFRLRVDASLSFADLLKQVKMKQGELIRHQKYPYNRIIPELRERFGFTGALLPIFFNYHPLAWDTVPEDAPIQYDTMPLGNGHQDNELTVHIRENVKTGEMAVQIDYLTDLFAAEDMDRLFARLMHVLREGMAAPMQAVEQVNVMPPEECHEILQAFSIGRNIGRQPDGLLHELFEEQAAKTPERMAVLSGLDGTSLTYGQLNERANKLARTLCNLGIGMGQPVAILGERSPAIVTAVLAVLKAGGAFVPLDHALPSDRLAYMVADSGANILLMVDSVGFALPDGCRVLDLRQEECYAGDASNLRLPCRPEQLAYLIYTSGTTGTPKGVMVEHQSWMQTAWAWRQEYKLEEMEIRLLQLASFSFDVFAGDLARTLPNGGMMVFCPDEVRLQLPRLHRMIVECGITLLESTPALLVPLMDYIYEHRLGTGRLELLILGSDRLAATDFRRLHSRFGSDMRILNSYGVTEACIDASYYEVEQGEQPPGEGNVPIGKPLPHVKLYVLGRGGTLQPVGVPGELCIGGEGVARGYLNRPELTSERFVEDPYAAGGRIYLTGDQARWLPDGNLEFLGRLDDQLSIRGYRVEPGEIEAQLMQFGGIREAVVAVMPDRQGEPVLCAYYTGETELEITETRSVLSSMLPDYMVPAIYMRLERLPLTPNSKVDRKALPKPDAIASRKEYVRPTTDAEQKMALLWQEVLNKEFVGLHDNFFELGGHSLKAMTLLTRIHQEFRSEIGLRDIFQTTNLKTLTQAVTSAAERAYEDLLPAPKQAYYPLSSAQTRLYVLHQLDEAGLGYNMPAAFQLAGPLDKERLEAAFQSLINRHEALRTSFTVVDGEPMQEIHDEVSFSVSCEDTDEGRADEQIRTFIRPFDLGAAPLLRTKVIQLGEERHLLLFDMHHIISDGISVQILTEELAALYAGEELNPLRLQYKDYAVWQQEYRQSQAYAKQEAYWLKEMAGELPVLSLPADYPRPAMRSIEGGRADFELKGELAEGVRKLAQESGSTVYMVLLAAYSTLLSRLSGQEEIIVGTPVAGRPHADLASMLGMFVNTLALRTHPAGDKRFSVHLQEIRQTALSAFDHGDFPFEELVDQVVRERDTSRNPIFDAMLVLQNTEHEVLQLPGLRLSSYPFDYIASKFDLTLTVTEEAGGFSFTWEYAAALFSHDTIERWTGCFLELLRQAVASPHARLDEYILVTGQERQLLLEHFAGTKAEYRPEATVLTLFEEQVALTPDLPAVIFGDEELSYRELNERAEQRGAVLCAQGVGAETIAAVMMHRSCDMAVGLIAVLKAGGAYLPIDPQFPMERIRYMLSDSRPKVLLTSIEHKSLAEEIGSDIPVIYFEDNECQDRAAESLKRTVAPAHLAYVIYTSGTTGASKGVMIEHGSLANTIQWKADHYRFSAGDKALMLNPFIFDSFVTHFFGPLVSGAAVVLLNDHDSKEPSAIREVIAKRRITHMQSPPSFYSALLESMDPDDWHTVRSAVLAGEAVGMALIRRLKAMNRDMELMNEYGPTENTVVTTATELVEEKAVTIGRPIPNTRVYILTSQGLLTPLGVPGELCIAGSGVARGYINQPQLTADKFTSDPFVPGERMYRTGDWARWLPDGTLEYLGRIDHQVKIRGNRIELGDIEAHLMTLPGIREAAVTVVGEAGDNLSLCAYFVAERDYPVKELRAALGHTLPSYMIPAYFIPMEQMPLTANGKLDRRALPLPDGRLEKDSSYIAPRNPAEQEMAEVWQEVLGVRPLGVRDDFFERGGHSLKGAVLVSRIQKRLQADITLRDLFQHPTVETLAEVIASRKNKAFHGIEQADSREHYPLTSAQKRMYVLQQLDGAELSYNMPAVLRMEGKLNRLLLESSLQQLVARHDSLRTSFIMADGEPVQRIHEKMKLAVDYCEAGEEQLHSIIAAFIHPFDLSQAPLLRVKIVRAANRLHYVLLDMHHIISDGVSMDIFVEEFTKLYAGEALVPLKLQYKDYAVWQQEYVLSDAYRQQEKYWLDQLAGELPVLQLPTDFARPALRSFAGDRVDFKLGRTLSEAVQQLALDTGVTVYMVFLAAYSTLLSRLSGDEEVIVGSPVAGRPHADLADMMGMFVNTLALRTFPSGQKAFTEYLEEIKQTALDAFEHGEYPFEELVDRIVTQRDMSRNPLFDAVFVLQNAENSQLDLPDLTVESYPFADAQAKFDLTLMISEGAEGYHGSLEFATALFTRDTVERWAGHLTELLDHVTSEPDTTLAEARLMSGSAELNQLITYSGLPVQDKPRMTIHQRFEEIARLYPERTAIVCGERHLTYAELQLQARLAAARLRREGIRPRAAVAILAERSIEFVVAVLGIVQAGGVYVPLDPDAPAERHLYILGDCGAEFLLAVPNSRVPASYPGKVIMLDDGALVNGALEALEELEELEALEASAASEALEALERGEANGCSCDDPAYILYTSGTTGRPKGVLVTHGNVINLVNNAGYVRFHADHRFAQTGAVSFDAATFEIFGALLHGSSLHPVEKDVLLDARRMGAFMAEHGITVMFLTTSLFHQLADEEAGLFAGVEHLIMGGEVLSPKHAYAVKEACPGLTIWNGYGPTENTTFSTAFAVEEPHNKHNIPIGRPIEGTTAYVLSARGQLLPVGVPGELCLGGGGVAAGYWNLPELTEEKFVPDPWIEGGRMYRTGDLARWLPDGTLEYWGRIDQQVKIRGYRIELGEIEARLLLHADIRQAAVVTWAERPGSEGLCAYYVSSKRLEPAELRHFLSIALPEYMVPAHFVHLSELPLTRNGKLDRKALPEPAEDMATASRYIAPRTATEARLAELWQEVLHVSQVGIRDNFFELGGHSLRAMILVSRIHQSLGIPIAIRDVFRSPTVEAMALTVDGTARDAQEALRPAGQREYYPLSSAQRRLYVLQQLEGAERSYNMPAAMLLEGQLDRARLEFALQELAARHEVLRTRFDFVNGEPVQIICPEVDFSLSFRDAEEDQLQEILQNFIRPFDLGQAPLLRIQLIKLADMRHLLLFDMHHIISDGTSMEILIKEMTSLYMRESLPQLSLHYKDYAVWQNAKEHSEEYARHKEYWLEQLAGELPILSLPSDFVRPPVQSFEGSRLDFNIDAELTGKLRKLAQSTGTTLFMVLLSAYSAFLSRISGQEDMIVGTPIAGRPHADLSNILGMFVNTLAIRSMPSREKTFAAYLEEVKQIAIEAFEHADYPFEELVDQVVQQRDISRNPIFDVMFALQNMEQSELRMEEVEVSRYELENSTAKFDLSLFISEQGDQLHCSLEYATALFESGTIGRWQENFIQLLRHAVDEPGIALGKVTLLSEQERNTLAAWHDGPATELPDTTIHQLFREQAAKTPDGIALVVGDTMLTYRELDQLSDQLSLALQHRNIGAGSIVGLMAGRSPYMTIGLLGILKAGAAFLPVDPSYPAERIAYMLEDSQAACLLIDSARTGQRLAYDGETLIISDLFAANHNVRGDREPAEISLGEQNGLPLYVIYTSGTTGNPKGVILKHRNLINLVLYQHKHTSIPFHKNVLQYASYSFDVSYQEIFTTLLAGGTLHVVDEEMRRDPIALFRYIEDQGIETIYLPAFFVKFAWNDPAYEFAWPSSVRHIITAGEALVAGKPLQRYLRERGVTLHNHYGPSETHVATTYTVTPNDVVTELPPIGRPISNSSVYILDPLGCPQPIGVAGELCIGGACVGEGYLKQPERTRERFISNPFSSGERMYRTGEWARWLADGNIEYLGRMDHQVKIRGYRIELGEIETRLLGVKGIREAAVLVHRDEYGSNELCAYIAGEREFSYTELREALGTVMPDYMIPSSFVQLGQLPVTRNGKVDRRALPKPDGAKAGKAYEAPRTNMEAKLALLWQDVLGVERVGIHDNFFELGGHSLRAMTLASRIHQTLDVEVPLRLLFQAPTVAGLAAALEAVACQSYEALLPVAKQAYYPVSSAQKRLYLLQQLEGAGLSYNMPVALQLEGTLDKVRLEDALQAMIERHEPLRTSFMVVDGEPVQRVEEDPALRVIYEKSEEADAEKRIQAFLRPFDLSEAPLLRMTVVRLAEDRHLLLFDMHHIISDGTSMNIFIEEFMKLYAGEPLEPLRLQYKDYAVWQRNYTQMPSYRELEAYWREQFAGELPVLTLPADHPRRAVRSFEGGQVDFELDSELATAMRELARANGATVYMVLLAAYSTLLSRLSGQEEIIVGSPVAGRPHADLESMLGMFVNTLALRMYPARDKSFAAYLQEVKQTAIGAFEHGNYPFEELVEQVVRRRDTSRNPLFDAMLVLQNTEQVELELSGLRLSSYPFDYNAAKFDVTLSVREHEEGIRCSLEYSSMLFDRETIERWADHFTELLRQVSANPQVKLGSACLLTAAEQEQLLVRFNDTKAPIPEGASISSLFERQAAKTPDRPAVVCAGRGLTYRELEEQANRIARWLHAHGVTEEERVGVLMNRSPQLIAGLLGILKAGAAYVPIDPMLPKERMEGMIRDSGMQVMLTDSAQLGMVTGLQDTSLRHVLCQDDALTEELVGWTNHVVDQAGGHEGNKISLGGESISLSSAEELAEYSSASIDVNIKPSGSAYVIYTSGTTGMPKGVVVEHRNAVNFISGMIRELPFGTHDSMLCITTVSFDIFAAESWVPLSCGMQIVLASEAAQQDPAVLAELLAQHPVQMAQLTPSRLMLLLADARSAAQLRSLTTLLVGGEAFPSTLYGQLRKYTDAALYNMYGPTETTVWSTFDRLEGEEQITIGRPMANTQAYVLNEALQPQPIGVAGELCIGGMGVARGYWARPELTAEKFVDSPFVAGERLYRTGDLARWLPDGRLEHLGRSDHQVKIRGYRIELGEIEARLLRIPGVSEAVVTAVEMQEHGQDLCAYLTGEYPLAAAELRAALAASLPSYMMPAHYMQLEKLPLTPNGKVDRRALPKPAGSGAAAGYVVPRTDVETKLAQLWQEVLGVERVGIHDDFFELGGHSLKAMTLVSKIHPSLGVELPLRQIFLSPTVEGLAAALMTMDGSTAYQALAPAGERAHYPLSSAQKRLYVLQQLEGAELSYNMPVALRLEGRLDRARLEAALQALIARHEALRTSFAVVDGEPVQRVQDEWAFSVSYEEAEEEEVEERIRAFLRPFDLSEAPLLRATVVRFDDTSHMLLFDMHHIISDGTSISILVDEFAKLYAGEALEPLPLQYKDYAVWQREHYADSQAYEQLEAYWVEQLAGELPVLSLPADHPRPAVRSFEGGRVDVELDGDLAHAVRELARMSGATVYMVLLAAYSTLLARLGGQEEVIVGSPVAGRPHADLEGMLGMFVNTLALRTHPSGEKSFAAFLQEVKLTTIDAFEHGEYPFEELVERVVRQRDTSRNPLFDAMLVLQNMDQAELALPDLRLTPYLLEDTVAKFDLTLIVSEQGEGFSCRWEYSSALFTEETIRRWAEHFAELLRHVARQPDTALGAVSLLTAAQERQLMQEFNPPRIEPVGSKTILELFEEQVLLNPNRTAVVFNNRDMSYAELNDRASRLAQALRQRGAGSEDIVGVLVTRSAWLVVAVLAVWKAGAAYLPLDADYPAERIAYMLEESRARLLLTEREYGEEWGASYDVLCLEDDDAAVAEGISLQLPEPGHLAYIIFTSGTTGKPKGVMIEHGHLIERIFAWNQAYGLDSQEIRLLQMASFSFDVFVEDMARTLPFGGTMVICPSELRLQPAAIAGLIRTHAITLLNSTPSFVMSIMKYIDERKVDIPSLRLLILGGDRCLHPDFHWLLERFGHTMRIINCYGVTEATVDSSFYEWTGAPEQYPLTPSGYVPIGRPFPNVRLYVVNPQYGNLQPIGVYGELYIGGAGVGRGYMNRPRLSEEKFIPSFFMEGERLYKTGDLVRWLPDGSLEFAGRNDHQVKIRGYRIELGEIEQHLTELEGVADSAVVACELKQGDLELCAYVVASKETEISSLRKALSARLPGFMVPAYFVRLEELPLTPNGKVDRRALPLPSKHGMAEGITAPRTKVQEKLAALFEEVLGVGRVGIHDNFFELGGHSLKAMTLVSKIHQALGVELPLRQLFLSPTVEGLAAELIATGGSAAYQALAPAGERAHYPLSSAQKRLYVLQQLEGAELSYNMPVALR